MKNIIPYEKDIEFDNKIAEITSISLEHDERKENDEIVGDFIISGDYKIHQISVNKEKFMYKIPFTIELTDNIDKDSVELDINDFTYDIKDNKILTVKIELAFNYKEIEDAKIETLDEEEIINNEERSEEELNEEIDSIINETEIENDNKTTIINNSNKSVNTYITYHVYVINKDDTIDTICKKFNVTKELLSEYNIIEEIKAGDKLLIPIEEDE